MVQFGGEDCGALVFDFGTKTSKIGFGGEETPRSVFPSVVGSIGTPSSHVGGMEVDQPNKNNYLIGTEYIYQPRENLELNQVMEEGMVKDWHLFEQLWHHSFKKLGVDPSEHPVLISNSAWDTKQNREKLCELAFETFKLPGLYLARSPVLSAFAAGRSTALVIESGAATTSVVPVFDGYIVKKAIQKGNIGGDFVSDQVLLYLNSQNIDLTPTCMVSSKQPVDSSNPPKFTKRNLNLTKSFQDYHRDLVIHDFKETVLNVPEQGYNERDLKRRPTKNYEFPTGFNTVFAIDRFKLVESLFQPGFVLNPPKDTIPVTIPQLITSSIVACDAELQHILHTNAVLTGANTLLHGFADRVYNELHRTSPGVLCTNQGRIKVQAAGGSHERRFGSWIGGSILSSLGSFNQLWISKAQYEEVGSSVEKKIY